MVICNRVLDFLPTALTSDQVAKHTAVLHPYTPCDKVEETSVYTKLYTNYCIGFSAPPPRTYKHTLDLYSREIQTQISYAQVISVLDSLLQSLLQTASIAGYTIR